jgi:hypothetical protein
MPDWADVRRILAALPETEEDSDRLRFTVHGKPICWPWLERVEAGKPRVPRLDVMAVRVANELDKEGLLAAGHAAIFSEPHYDGWPAVLVRLAVVPADLLDQLLTDAWRWQAPRSVVRAADGSARG